MCTRVTVVCVSVCYQSSTSVQNDKLNLQAQLSLNFEGFQLADFAKKLSFSSYSLFFTFARPGRPFSIIEVSTGVVPLTTIQLRALRVGKWSSVQKALNVQCVRIDMVYAKANPAPRVFHFVAFIYTSYYETVQHADLKCNELNKAPRCKPSARTSTCYPHIIQSALSPLFYITTECNKQPQGCNHKPCSSYVYAASGKGGDVSMRNR